MRNRLSKYRILTLGAIGFIITSCSSKYRVITAEDSEKKIYNLPYGEHRHQKMDIFLPSGYNKNVPAVILVHGGAWKLGKKEHLIMIQKYLHRNKIATININYRLVNKKITYKDQVADIGSAVEKLNTIASLEGLAENNYIILGESSGGHIALLYGYKNPDRIKKIISLSCPTDFYSKNYAGSFYSKYTLPTIQDVVGEKFDRSNISDEFRKASPVANVSNVPTLIFQGGRDILVNKSQGLALDSVLSEKNIPHKLVFMESAGHIPRFFSKKTKEEIILPNILEWVVKDNY